MPHIHNTHAMNKVSILIAVYNAEKYLRDCLDSLLRQTHQDFQAICVDDASTDGSADILREYAADDRRFEVVTMKENGGQAVARNAGLTRATGQYITVLDADDWLSDDALEQALDTFGKHSLTDCVLFDLRYVNADGKEHGYAWTYPKEKFASNADGSFESMSGHNAFLLSLTWKIHGLYVLRADIFKKYPFDDSSRHFSDDNTTRAHFRAAREVRCCSGKYYYRQVETSVSHVVNTSRMDHMKANASMKRTLMEWHESEQVISFYEQERWRIIVDSYLFYFVNRREMTRSQAQFCLGEIRKYRESIERHRLNRRQTLKLGYFPFLAPWLPKAVGWALFRAEEETYFHLKKWSGRL